MSGSCPVGATVCRDAHAEAERLRGWKAEALPVLDGLQELGKALGLPLGSQITGTEALAAVERLTSERDAARAEAERLRAGIKALAVSGARGIDLTPTTTGYVSPQWVYDYLATLDSAWRDRVRRLLDPTEGGV